MSGGIAGFPVISDEITNNSNTNNSSDKLKFNKKRIENDRT
jgi:hypothetical protein